jgi:hypothetical protein
MAAFVEVLRSGSWLARIRIPLIALALIAASAVGLAYLVIGSDGLHDRVGRPLGTDFANVYAAGSYVLEGRPSAPFDPQIQEAREHAIFGATTAFFGWHYPPYFLGLAALMALAPYALALALWQGVTLALYLLAIRAIAPPAARSGDDRHLWLLLALAFPAVFINLGHGHNGFLTAALFAGALVQLDRRPWLAGILFGCLVYKPQFGLLIPLVLVASSRWRVFAAACGTVALLTLAVTIAFGPEVWRAFLASTGFTRTVILEAGATGWYKIQSVFAWTRMWGGSVSLAYALQGIATVIVATAVTLLWRSPAAFPFKAAGLLIGTVLVTPYSLDYDLMLLAPAIAFLIARGAVEGFAPWEKTALAALWIVPLIARSVAEATLIPLAVPAMLATLTLVTRQAFADRPLWQPAPRPIR